MKILVRLSSDLTVKSDRIRAKFVTRMIRNMTQAFTFHGVDAAVDRQWSRLFVRTEDPRALEVLKRTFGVMSFSVIEHECKADLETVVAVGEAAYADFVAGKTFAVRSRRVGPHEYTSMDVARALGAKLNRTARGVDLKRPEVIVHVEIRDEQAYLYSGQTPGPGGLPLGVSGRVLCLFSGGYDSAVAAWRLMKRGCELDFVFCNLAGPAYERSVLGLAKLLADDWGQGTKPRVHVVDFAPVVEVLRREVKPSHAQVLLKRMFYRVGELLASKVDALALVTGECVGQVSSQTLRNLATIESVVSMPILRPVIGLDKEEIIAEARRIGTYEVSSKIQEYCQLVPDKPVTACRTESAEREESRFDPAALAAAVVLSRREVQLAALTVADLTGPYLHAETVPDDAVVVDCRPAEEYDLWHYPGAMNLELHELLTRFAKFDKRRTYILYCPVGLQSAVAAETMQGAGYQAYSFKGGARRLRDGASASP